MSNNIHPVLSYGAETLTLTKSSENMIKEAQRAMNGISFTDKMTNQWN